MVVIAGVVRVDSDTVVSVGVVTVDAVVVVTDRVEGTDVVSVNKTRKFVVESVNLQFMSSV